MIFGLIGDLVGGVVGTIGGLSYVVIAKTLGVAEDVVKKAVEAGCTTVDEIRKFTEQ